MDYLFMAEVEMRVYRDWEYRFNKRVVRRSGRTGFALPQPIQSLVDSLKRAL